MINKIKENVWQLHFKEFGSCVYIIKLSEQTIMIDTGSSANEQELLKDLTELKIKPEQINILILTHNHWDHVGNIDLFTKAKVYGSKKDFKNKDIFEINKLPIKEFKIIKTPGHTKGGICILYNDILFSGDTIFDHGAVGRTDLPGGNYKELQESIENLHKIDYKILCAGHLV